MGRTSDDLPDHSFQQYLPGQDPRARRNLHNGHVELELVYRGYRLRELAKRCGHLLDFALDKWVHVLSRFELSISIRPPLLALTIQGNSVTLPSGKNSYAAIDTGTTLIGGPQDAIQQIYASIPGSSPATGNFAGYYTYREPKPSPTRKSTFMTKPA